MAVGGGNEGRYTVYICICILEEKLSLLLLLLLYCCIFVLFSVKRNMAVGGGNEGRYTVYCPWSLQPPIHTSLGHIFPNNLK